MIRIPYVHSTDIVGYTHSGCYYLCEVHANYGQMKDAGNETGFVSPIFAGDEFDFTPTCDVCGDELDVVVIGEEE